MTYLREYILKGAQGPDRDKLRQPPARGTHSTPSSKKGRIIYACSIEAHESFRKRTQETQHKDHEDHIAVRRLNSLSHHNLVHKPVPILCAMMIPDGNAAVDTEWIERPASMARDESQKQQGGHRAGAKRRQNSSFCDAHGLMPLKELGLRTEVPENTMAATCYEETL